MASPFEPPLTESEIAPLFEDLSILRAVKSGGQGATFEAVSACDGTRRALKVYGAATEPERVKREIKKLRVIDSPHVMRVLGDIREVTLRGEPVLAAEAEWIEGEDLVSILRRANGATPFDETQVKRLLSDGSRAIEALADHAVLHRDINPNNIMQRADGTFVLLDLGYAKHLDMSSLSGKGQVCDTRGVISPERLWGERRPTFRSDLFSLGVVAYVMASGCHPFGGRDEAAGSFQFMPIDGLSRELNQLLFNLTRPTASLRAQNCHEIRQACGES